MITCPHCSQPIKQDPALAGQNVSCPGCQQLFQMPSVPVAQTIVENEGVPRINTGVRAPASCHQYNGPAKNPGVAAVCSFLFVGMGQVYNGDLGKAMLLWCIGFFLALFAILTLGFGLIITLPLSVVFWVFGIWDAYASAEKFNRKRFRR